jgi:hypothetical protein
MVGSATGTTGVYQLLAGGVAVPGTVAAGANSGSTQHQVTGFAVLSLSAGAAVSVQNAKTVSDTLQGTVGGVTATSVMLTIVKVG